jgi:hypothetical protein
MPKISLLLPTRGRPFLVHRLFQSIVDHAAKPDKLEIVLYVDEDDFGSHGIEDNRLNILKIIGPRLTMGGYNTICMQRSSGDIIGLINDDITIQTPDWDQRIRDLHASIHDGVYLAYPNDMDRMHTLSTFPIMTRKTCEILMDPYPAEYSHLFIDTHLFDIFMRLKHLGMNRVFFLDQVHFIHLHTKDGKGEEVIDYQPRDHYKDSMAFIRNRYLRQTSAQRLLSAIERKELPDLSACCEFEPPLSLLDAFVRYFRIFMLDEGLPIPYRFHLYKGIVGYHAVVKSGLSFLRRGSLRSDLNA